MLDYVLCWALTGCVAICGILARRLQGGWLTPGGTGCLVWFVACSVPLLF
jgi:hypothetical protein